LTSDADKQQDAPSAEQAETKRPARATARKAPAGTGAKAPRASAAKTAEAEAATKKGTTSTVEQSVVTHRPAPRLMARYRDEMRGTLIREFGYRSSMEAPRVTKVVLNIGLGEALTNSRALETAPQHLAAITGQKPVITKARDSVAGFKVREGQAIGVMVTLRGRRMYEFLDRLISVALPRIRDFRGVPRTSFDGRGNYALGLREQVMFPEIDYGMIDKVRGMQVIIATSAKTDPEAFRLLELMGMPFVREGQGS
jgi:large subunit ribosomal protein L5